MLFRASYLFLLIASVTAWTTPPWLSEQHKGYRFYYTPYDAQEKLQYNAMIRNGMKEVTGFFNERFNAHFLVYMHPDRHSLDSTWQKDWNDSSFKSECWMVASGTAKRLDILSPLSWETSACEHKYSDKIKTAQVITHELVHVYHGQRNLSPDFSNANGIDWFVEGLATYASGQLTDQSLQNVKQLITDDKLPSSLSRYWTGKLKYPLSGSVVRFIDKNYGRKKLVGLLKFNQLSDLLAELNITEEELVRLWKSDLAASNSNKQARLH